MNCADLRDSIAERVAAGQAPPDHCDGCRTYAGELSELARKLAQLPPSLERHSRPANSRHARWLAGLAAAAVIALALVLALGRKPHVDEPRPAQAPPDFEQHPQRVSDPGMLVMGKIDWELPIAADGEGHFKSPVVEGDRLFLSGHGAISAFDLAGRKLLWTTRLPGRTNGSPALWGDFVYITSFAPDFRGKLFCLEKTTGKAVWDFTIKEGFAHMSPLVVGDGVFAGNEGSFGKERGLIRLDARSGRTHWASSPVPYGYNARPVVYKDTVVALSAAGTLAGLEASTGRTLWTRAAESMAGDALLLSGEQVVAKTRHGKLFAVRATDGARSWTMEGEPDDYSEPQIAEGQVYAVLKQRQGFPARVVRVDLQTGKLMWTSDLPVAEPEATPCVTKLAVYIPTGGRLRALSTRDGTLLWEVEIGRFLGSGSRLALHQGALYGCFERGGRPALVAIR